jgi:hypothetical protein
MNRLLGNAISYAEALGVYLQLLYFASAVIRRLMQDFLPGYNGNPDAQRAFG